MKREDILFKKLLSANRGDKKAKWEIINIFEKEINRASKRNSEVKNIIIVRICDLFDDMEEKFEMYFKTINK